MPSILQPWVEELPIREQGVMLSAVRGCDTTAKPNAPGEGPIERHLVAFLRWTFLIPADDREVEYPGAFMRDSFPMRNQWKPSEMGHLPVHFYAHLMHAFQVVGNRHPELRIRQVGTDIYTRMVECLHLRTEPYPTYVRRLSEDRIATGTVVS